MTYTFVKPEGPAPFDGLTEAVKLIDYYLETSKSVQNQYERRENLMNIRKHLSEQAKNDIAKTLRPQSAYFGQWKFLAEQLHNIHVALSADQSFIVIDFKEECLQEALRHINQPTSLEARNVVLVLISFYSSIEQRDKPKDSSRQPIDARSRLFDILTLAAVDDVMLELEKKPELDFSVYFSKNVISRLSEENSEDPIVQLLSEIVHRVAKVNNIEPTSLIRCIQQRDKLYDQEDNLPDFLQRLRKYRQNKDEYDLNVFLLDNGMLSLTPSETGVYSSLFSKYLIKDKQTENGQTQVIRIVQNYGVFNNTSRDERNEEAFVTEERVPLFEPLIRKCVPSKNHVAKKEFETLSCLFGHS